MRGIAKFLTLVTVIVLLACGYVIWASELSVSSAGAVVESAADRADAFESIRQMSEWMQTACGETGRNRFGLPSKTQPKQMRFCPL